MGYKSPLVLVGGGGKKGKQKGKGKGTGKGEGGRQNADSYITKCLKGSGLMKELRRSKTILQQTKSEVELKRQLDTVWACIPQKTIDGFAKGFVAKIARCRAAGGQ